MGRLYKMGERMIILFDLDGTLIDSTDAILESFFLSCEKNNLKKPNEEEVKSLIGYPLDIMFSRVGAPKEKVWDFVTTYKEHYRKISTQKTKLLPNAKEAVTKANKFARLGIVTTKTARYSKELMEYFGLMKYFEVLIGREDVTNPKPHSEPILKALEKMKIKNHNDCYIIGDTILDLKSAKEASINGIAVLSGYGKEEKLRKYTDLVFKDTLEAINFLQKVKN